MKIVYCLQGLFRSGGIERVVTTKANYLAERGHDVYIITTDQREYDIVFLLNDRVKHIDLGLNYEEDNVLGRWRRLLALQRKKKVHHERLEKALFEIRPQITISTFFQDASILPSIKDGSKKVLELHSSRYTPILMHPKEKWLLRFVANIRIWYNDHIAKRYDQFIILTDEELPLYSHLKNVRAIPNPKPNKFENNGRANLKAKQIIAVGRLEYQKNYQELISIWATIHMDFPDWHLIIIGDGYLYRKLEEQISRLNLSERIELLPATPHIADYYLASSIFVLTSHYEGLPMVLIEAQSLGLPIVSYICPCGPQDIVSHGSDGFLVEQYNQAEFAKYLSSLMRNEKLRVDMGSQAQNNSNRYSISRIMQKWELLFSEILK